VAKTYALQAVERAPGAGQNTVERAGGRVDLEEKITIDNILILLEIDEFLKALREGCG
jgi:hypothetical protein